MFTQIMVPLDGSALAERALPSAARLAAATGATLHLVRVVEPLPGAVSVYRSVTEPSRHLDREAWAATEYLDTIRTRLAAGGVRAEVHPRLGHALDALLLEQYTTGIDLVVMCSHGRGGVSRVALGSVATGLLQRGTAPVLLARAFGEPVALDQAVVPLDGSARAEEALRLVERLAGSVIHEVTLLRVIDRSTQGPEAERYLEQIAHSLQARGVHCTPRVERGSPAERIKAVAGRTKLVVMTTRGRGAVLRWALGSVADRVARGGATAVLLVRVGVAPALAEEDTSSARSRDATIQQEVLRELARDGRVAVSDVGVAVDNGVVTLSGTVSSVAEKAGAQDAAHRVPNVRDVANTIVVKLPRIGTPTDMELAQAVRTALELNEAVPHQRIRSTVSNGWVMLHGMVDQRSQREAAERAVQCIAGMRGVSNAIMVCAQQRDADEGQAVSTETRAQRP
jgi:nucleotide-binding universal stress UspA family protein